MAASSLSAVNVVITGLFHDLTLKRSTVSVVWDTIPISGWACRFRMDVRWMTFRPRPKRRCGNCPTWPPKSPSNCRSDFRPRHGGLIPLEKKQGAAGITTAAPYVTGQWGRGDNRLPG
jgi:hypothetical protein